MLAESLPQNRGLKALGMGHIAVTNDGAEAIAEVLRNNSALSKLYLPASLITTSGAEALAAALEKNKALTLLDLQKNEIDSAVLQRIKQLTDPRGAGRVEL